MPQAPSYTTRVQRNPGWRKKAAGWTVALLAAAGWAFYSGSYVWGVGFLLMTAAAVVVAAGFGTAVCPMPGCGAAFPAETWGNMAALCRRCGTYFEGKKGELRPIPDDRVFPKPLYWARLWQCERTGLLRNQASLMPTLSVHTGDDKPLALNWPPGCCVCGAGVSRFETATLTALDKNAKAGGLLDEKLRLVAAGIPHCGAHNDGADLDVQDGVAVIKFRWLGYRNAFRKLNPPPPHPGHA